VLKQGFEKLDIFKPGRAPRDGVRFFALTNVAAMIPPISPGHWGRFGLLLITY
jgi:hypothetical protein